MKKIRRRPKKERGMTTSKKRGGKDDLKNKSKINLNWL
jgi:hypothetical protein